MAVSTASRSECPSASCAVIAAESAQPVPCVLVESMRRRVNTRSSAPSNSTSATSRPRRCPPLMSAAPAPRATNSRAQADIASTSRTASPVRRSASSRLGVTSAASGRSDSMIAGATSSLASVSPDVAIITGSSTYGASAWRRSPAATASMIARSASMPLFTAAGRRSVATASSCAVTSAGVIAVHAETPRVFCAVTAVTTVVPKTPKRWNVFRSAWMPAPPPESEPAMESAISMPNDAARRARLQRRDGRRRRRVQEGRLTLRPDGTRHMEPLATNVLYIGVDSSTAVLRAALELVSRSGHARFALTHAPVESAAGLARLADGGVDVVIVDAAASPEGAMDALVRSRIEAPDVPVVVLGAGADGDAAGAAALQAGAQDWVARDPLDGPLLARVLRYAIERERLQSTLRQLALTDPLTGLYNRRGFLTLADHHLRLAPRTRGLLLASADVPALKQINEQHGRDEGDRSLVGAAEVLRETFRASDVVARLGADDFAVLVLDGGG